MPKFMGHHCAELGHGERLEQRQPQAHHSTAPKAHDAPALRHPGVQVHDEIHLFWHGLSRSFGDGINLLKQTGLGVRREARPWRIETVGTGDYCPQDNARPEETEGRQFRLHAVEGQVFEVRDCYQKRCYSNGHDIEADHQDHCEHRTQGYGRCTRHENSLPLQAFWMMEAIRQLRTSPLIPR
jgi:hypothetical protein